MHPTALLIRAMFAILLCLCLFSGYSLAQQSEETLSWREGNAAFAYPAGWIVAETGGNDEVALLILQAVEHPTALITVEHIRIPESQVIDILTSRLEQIDLILQQPVLTDIADLPAYEIIGEAASGEKAGIGRGLLRVDGSILLVHGHSPAEANGVLLDAYSTLIESLVLDARQMPRVPGTPDQRFTRLGSALLTADTAAFGVLNAEASSQTWQFAGTIGERISLFATDIERLETLNLRLTLRAPDGTVAAQNDNHSGGAFYGLFSLYDAALLDVILPTDGLYTVLVEAVFGEGMYGMGLRRANTAVLADGEAVRFDGSIDDVFAAQNWIFGGTAGRTYTITMMAEEGSTLDPALRIYGADGTLIEQNDDARDPSLGLNAQLVGVRLPADGWYRLEATRYAGEGEGRYELIILETG